MKVGYFIAILSLYLLFSSSQGFSKGNELKLKKEKSVYIGQTWDDLQNLQKSGRNVLIFHYISSCSSCKVFLPIFEKVAAESEMLGYDVNFAKIDVMKFFKKIDSLQIKQYPSLQFFKYGKQLTTYSGEKTHESLLKFVREASFPLKEIVTVEMFDEIYKREGIFSVFIGDKNNQEFQVYEFSSSTYGDMGHYYVSTNNMDQIRLKENILQKFNEYHVGENSSIILLINTKSIKKHHIFDTFEVKKIEEFYTQYAYSQLDILDERNMNKLLNRNSEGIIFICDDSPKCTDAERFLPELAIKFNNTLSVFVSNKRYIQQNLQKKLENLFTLKNFNSNGPQFYFIKSNGKQIFHLETSPTIKINLQNIENFIHSALRGDLPRLVESEPIPKNNTQPILQLVGKSFEKEVYKSNEDVIVYFKSNFLKESESLSDIMNRLVKYVEQNGMSRFVKIAQIDMTKNHVYSENEQFLEDIEVIPKLYYFIADNSKQDGIKLNGKDFNYLTQIIPKISSFDWDKKSKKTDIEIVQIRAEIQKLVAQKDYRNDKDNKKKQDL